MKIEDLRATVQVQIENLPPEPDQWLNRFTVYAGRKLVATLESMKQGDNERELMPDNIAPLIELCKELRDVVGETHFLALYRSNKSLAFIMDMIAYQITEADPSQNYYELLFSKLTHLKYSEKIYINLTDAREQNGRLPLPMHTFVLSDDGTSVIDVEQCLTGEVTTVGEEGFKHQFDPPALTPEQLAILDNLPSGVKERTQISMKASLAYPNLSAAEKDRVINHSIESRAYWNALQQKSSLPPSQSFGAVLKKLCEALRTGNYTRALSEEEKQRAYYAAVNKKLTSRGRQRFQNINLFKEAVASKGLQKVFEEANGYPLRNMFSSELSEAESTFKHENAGEAATVGVASFLDWYNGLTPQERKTINQLSNPRHGNLGGLPTYELRLLSELPSMIGQYGYSDYANIDRSGKFYLDKDGNYQTDHMFAKNRNLFDDMKIKYVEEGIEKIKDNPFATDVNVNTLREKLNHLPESLNDPELQEMVVKIALGHRGCKMTPLAILFDPALERQAGTTATCVALIGQDIEDFFENHPELSTMYPSAVPDADNLANSAWKERVDKAIKSAGAALEKAMQQDNNLKAYAYGQEAQAEFVRKVRALPDFLHYSPDPLALSAQQKQILAEFNPDNLADKLQAAHLHNLGNTDLNVKHQLLRVLLAKPLRGDSLSADVAISEMQGLDAQRCLSLATFYKDGLRGEHLRSARAFTDAHHNALQYLLRERQPTLTATDAFNRIRNLSVDGVRTLLNDELREAEQRRVREEERRMVQAEVAAAVQEEQRHLAKNKEVLESVERRVAEKLEARRRAPQKAGSPLNEGNKGFQYVTDSKTGLAAFYDNDRCTILPVDELGTSGKTKVKLYRVIPTDGQGAILHVEVHLPSGSSQADQEKRDTAAVKIKKLVAEFLAKNPSYTDVVYSMDANVSAFKCIEAGNPEKIEDYAINESGITHTLNSVFPDNLVLHQFATGENMVLKARAEDMGNNQQLDKAANRDRALKAYCSHAKVYSGADLKTARDNAFKAVLTNIPKPKKIFEFGKDDTYGSDHLETARLEVNGLGFMVFPLLGTFGARGYNDPNEYYNHYRHNRDAIRNAAQKATDAFLDIVIEELQNADVREASINGQTIPTQTLSKQDRGNNRLVRERAEFIKNTEKYLVNTPNGVENIVSRFATSPELQRWQQFVKPEKRKFLSAADQAECISRIRNKNYGIEDQSTKKFTDPQQEFIHIRREQNDNISYRLKNHGDQVVSGAITFTVAGQTLSSAEKIALRSAIIQDVRSKHPDIVIYNGKDIGGQIPEYLSYQSCAGYEFNLEGHPRVLQLARCSELVLGSQAGKNVDILTTTENSDMSHLQETELTERQDALLARAQNYPRRYQEEMMRACQKMTEYRNAARLADYGSVSQPHTQAPMRPVVLPAPVAPTPVAPNPLVTPVSTTPVDRAPTPVAPTPVAPIPVAPIPVASTPALAKPALSKKLIAGFALIGAIVGAAVAVAVGLAWPVILGIAIASAVGLGVVSAVVNHTLLSRKEGSTAQQASNAASAKAPDAYAASSAKAVPSISASKPQVASSPESTASKATRPPTR